MLATLDQYYLKIKENRWYWLFFVFCRISLAYAFLVAGIVKIAGERFASGLSALHPMGAYLEALHHTGSYYTFIGIAQVAAAILLLIPRTVTLGALLYFPIIVNIWLLSFAVRFEGSIVTSPLMVLANLYILVWNYDKLKFILPFTNSPNLGIVEKSKKHSNKFPFLFFSGVFATVGLVVAMARFGYEVMPRNSLSDCKKQFVNTEKERIGFEFCECIHSIGNPLAQCLEAFETAKKELGK
jgi:uncharacterized membrane protein YphA (DoxX/SURF4 family)